MQEIMSFLFDRFTDPLGLPLDTFQEWVILALIGFVAYIVAFRSVGDLYGSGIINGSTAGSIIHWIIRLVVFAAIWAVTYAVIAVGKFIIAHWGVVLCGLGGVLLVVAMIGVIVIVRRKRPQDVSSDDVEREDVSDLCEK